MKWSPVKNALTASAYIGGVVLFLQFIKARRHDTPDTPLDGMGAISLLVLSVAVMAFLFFYHPVTLLIENKKKEALAYFLKTLGTFSIITVLVLILVSV